MRIFELNSGYFYGLLNEANVINIKDDFDTDRETAVSIKTYLEPFLEHLQTEEAKKTFVKKLTKLLVNDERYHNVVRHLPPKAPPWALDAMRKRDLVYFKPDNDLDDAMQHLSHYVNALEHDMKSNNRDIQVFAQREAAGFPKAENLDILFKKSQEYFKRGTKKVERSEEGMVQIHDSGDGFRWFLLKTPEAYKREGKALQNCIGGYYTRSSARERGFEIVILRKPNDESIVAARVNNKEHTIEEMKGKNNKPPIEKYMPYVLDFVNGKKLKLDRTAESDFRRAGYFYIDNKMHTRPEAIKRYILKDTITKFPDGNQLVSVKTGSQADVVQELLRDLYPDMIGYNETPEIYELRNKNDLPLVSGTVKNKILEKIHRHRLLKESSTLLESVLKGKVAREFVGELIRRGFITSVNDKMARDLFWNERIKINHKTGKFDPVQPEKEIEGAQDRKKRKVTWEKHTDDDQVKMIVQSLKASGGFGGEDEKWDKMNIRQAFITREKMIDTDHEDMEKDGKFFALVRTENDLLVPVEVNVVMDRVSTTDVGTGAGEKEDEFIRRNRLIKSAVAIANQEGLNLTRSFMYNGGIVKRKGKYEVFKPKMQKLEGKPPAVKIDLSDISPGDRFNAINVVATIGDIRDRDIPKEHKNEDRLWFHDTEVQLKLDYHLAKEKYQRGQTLWSSLTQEDASDWEGHNPDEVYRTVFNGTPETIYLVGVLYGTDKKHQVFVLADGRTIIEVDGTTERHEYQKWGDHDKVAEQLNAFAKNNGLTYDKDALGDKAEFQVYNGKVMTKTMIEKEQQRALKQQGKIGQETTDKVQFRDGTTLIRMDENEVSEWARRGIDDTVRGEGWKFVDKKGNHVGVVVVHNKVIKQLYGPNYSWDENSQEMIAGTELLDMSNEQSVTPKLLSRLKEAKKQFKWRAGTGKQFVLRPKSDLHKLLRKAEKGQRAHESVNLNRLLDIGYVKTEEEQDANFKLKITANGKRALKKLDADKPANILV